LDIGCGIGTYALETMRRGHEIIGLELSEAALKTIKDENIILILASGKNLPFITTIFDRVLLIDVFEHINEPLKLLLEIHRTLKKKGILMLQTPNSNSIITSILKDPTHVKEYTIEEVHEFLQSSNFKNIYSVITSFLPRLYPISLLLRHFFKALIVVKSIKS